MYLDYILFHRQTRPPSTITGVIKRTYYVYFITLESIYIKSIHSGPELKSTISHDLCCVLGLYFDSSHMWKFTTYFEDGRILEYVGIISSQDSLDVVESQMDSNTIYDFKFQTCNLELQPA